MLYCENNNNINRCKSIYYLSNYINNQFKSNKYINVLSIILLLILGNIINNNLLYAEARDTDGVSIIRSGEDPSCISQCDSINENNIQAGATYLGDYGVSISSCNGIPRDVRGDAKRACIAARDADSSCRGQTYSGSSSGLSLFGIVAGFYSVYGCSGKDKKDHQCDESKLFGGYSISCSRIYKTYCYVDSPIHLEVSVSTSGDYSSEADVVSKVQEACNGSVGEFRSMCKTRCSAYKLKMGNREINTVRDLLDSVPTTEFLKVYDPNMVNY